MKNIVISSLIVMVLFPTLALAWSPRDECPYPRGEMTFNSFSLVKFYPATQRDKEIWDEKDSSIPKTGIEFLGVYLYEHKARNAPATYLCIQKFTIKGVPRWEVGIVVVERSFPVRVVHWGSTGLTLRSQSELDNLMQGGIKFRPEEFSALSLKTVILPKRGDSIKGWVNKYGGIDPERTALYEALNKAVDRWYEKGGGKP